MGDNHQYGRGDGTEDDPQAERRPRGYGQPGPDAGNRGYGQPEPPSGGRGYGSAPRPPQTPPSSPYTRGYGGSPDYGNSPDYGSAPSYDRPVDSYNGGGSRRGPQQPIRGEVIPGGGARGGNGGGNVGGGGGTRRMPAQPPADPDPDYEFGGSGGYSTTLPPPRRTRVEERQAARAKAAGTEAASQERSTRYERSPLDGRSTRNGAARGAAGTGPGGPKRPAKKTGYHRYFDYPRTGKAGWRHWTPSIKQVSSFMLGGFFLLIGLIAFEYYSVQIPTDPTLAQASIFQYDDASTQFATTGKTTRIEVGIDQVPKMMQNAIVSAENKTFWSDPGVSYTGIVRSVINDAEGKPLQGGSTLTQQYVKNAFLSDNQTFSRKLDEIFISLKISKSESKDWVLEHYLNTVDFGRNAAGVDAAAKLWLGKPISQITDPSDAALLASLVNAPSTFTQGFRADNPDLSAQAALKSRWQYVIGQMAANNYITQAQAAAAVFPTPVSPSLPANGTSVQDLQMQDAVNSWLDQWGTSHPGSNTPTADQVYAGGYTVVTTFNAQDMSLAAQAVQNEFTNKLTNPTTDWYNENLYPGLAAVNPKNGDLVAFFGGSTEENNATQRQVQPGSTFKAFTLATAYSEGYSENSYMDGTNPWPKQGDPNDAAILKTGSYSTVHNDGISPPQVSFDTATADSINTAFVRTEQEVGPTKVLNMVESMGINTTNAQNLNDSSGLTLGISSVSPARMADAYSTFADNGSEYPLVEVQKILLPGGGTWVPSVQPTQPVTPAVAETVTSTLTHVTHDPGATACGSSSDCATTQSGLQNIAGKTGTSTMDFTGIDADSANLGTNMTHLNRSNFTTAAVWFNGFTSNLEVAVDLSRWVTDSTGRAIQFPVDGIDGNGATYGAQYPLSIWSAFMKSMQSSTLGGDPAFTQPAPDPSASIMNSPTATPTPSATPTTAATTVAPTDSATDCPTDNGGFLGGNQPCQTGGGGSTPPSTPPSDTGTPTPSTSATNKHGGGAGFGGGTGTGD